MCQIGPQIRLKSQATSLPPINLATNPDPQLSGGISRQLVPIYIDVDRFGDVKEALRDLGIQAFSTADGHCEILDRPVPRPSELDLQDDASLHGRSIDQYSCDGRCLTSRSSDFEDFEDFTSTMSRLSMLTNSPHVVDSYPARSAPALFSGSSPQASPLKKKYYVVTVGKCVGVYYDEWHVYTSIPLFFCLRYTNMTFL